MFIQPHPGQTAASVPQKILLRAGALEKDRLARRTKELFPQAEIVAEDSEQMLFASLPLTERVFRLREKFAGLSQKLDPKIRSQAYLLDAGGSGFCIISEQAPGLYYGLLGLHELLEKKGGSFELFDHPRFGRRGFLQDLSRGQVLNLAGFERLLKALGTLRYNWLTFNLEHNFGYTRHPEISEGDDALTIAEAKALAALCREYFIEPVPMQQSLGHCRGILNKPSYRRLAFDERLLWSLDPRREEIYSLLEDMYQEQAECFPGEYFLVGCDEPFDLKKNWRPENAGGKLFPQVYLEHLLKLRSMLSGLKRKMMVWGDVFVSHPELLAELPEDVVVLNWQYGSSQLEDEKFYEDKSRAIAGSGKEFYVATTTWSYGRLFPELKTMESNNRNFLNVGERLKAQGALLTNWGDLGHLQLLGHVAMPIAYFGKLSWRESGESLEQFALDFSRCFFQDENGRSGEFHLLLDRVNEIISPGKNFGASALFVLLDELYSSQFLPARPLAELSEELLKVLKEAAVVTSRLVSVKNHEWILDLKPVIYGLGVLFTKLLLKDTASLGLKDKSKKEEVLGLFGHLENYSRNLGESLQERWLTQAKPLGLGRNLARLNKAAEGYGKRREQMARAEGISWEQLRDYPEFEEYKFNLLKEMGLEGLL